MTKRDLVNLLRKQLFTHCYTWSWRKHWFSFPWSTFLKSQAFIIIVRSLVLPNSWMLRYCSESNMEHFSLPRIIYFSSQALQPDEVAWNAADLQRTSTCWALWLQPHLSAQWVLAFFRNWSIARPEQTWIKHLAHSDPRFSQQTTQSGPETTAKSTLYFLLISPVISLSLRCVLIFPLGYSLRSPCSTHTHTQCIRVAVIYNTTPLFRPDNGYKQTIDMEMERCSSLAGAACFVNG